MIKFACTGKRSGTSVSTTLAALLAGAAFVLPGILPAGSTARAETLTIANPTPDDTDLFGVSVALDGGRALVGAHGDDAGATNTGIAHLFDAATGGLLRSFANPNPGGGDNLGFSVALSGRNALLGAWSDDAGAVNAGQAYLYDADTGALVQTFANPTPEANDYFGRSVAVSGDRALIGAWGDDSAGSDSGAAYLFDTVTGSLLQSFTVPSADGGEAFGYSVALDGDRALIGAWGDDTGAPAGTEASGAAYLFDTVSGSLLQSFANPEPGHRDLFGNAVALEGGYALIGAYLDDTDAGNAGRAYLYDAETGALVQTFANPTPETLDSFGISVALDSSAGGVQALIGAHRDDTAATDAGAAYLYDAATGTLLRTLVGPSPEAGDHAGYAVDLEGTSLLVGAFQDDTGATDAGAAYLYIPDTNSRALLSAPLSAPLPAGGLLLLTALGGLALLRRRARA